MSKKLWFEGLKNEEIVEKVNEMSKDAVTLMVFDKGDNAFDIYRQLEADVVELKEFISQNNDIRSTNYESRRQFIRDLNKIVVETYEKMHDAYTKNSKK
jgi:hypothetical protein